MSIELVTQPYVGIIARTTMTRETLEGFIGTHGLSDLADDESTPIAKLYKGVIEAELGERQSDLDLLSEFAGRFCYRSWGKGRSAEEYIENVLSERHGNVLAHSTVSLILTGVSRSLTHELVRHHVGTNPSQESQRYVSAEGGELEVLGFMAHRAVVPPLILRMADECEPHERARKLSSFAAFYTAAMDSYEFYLRRGKSYLGGKELPKTLAKKRAQEAARCFLPNAAETRLVWTTNLRAARWLLEQRGDHHADLEIRRLSAAIAVQLKNEAPLTFRDVTIDTHDDGFPFVSVTHSKV